jgi:hypothetical protein
LGARFGGLELDDGVAKEFQRRVRLLKRADSRESGVDATH